MESTFSPLFAAAAAAPTCDSCGRSPARPITVRRHVGLLVLQQFVTVKVTACRSCGRSLIGRFTARTLWQGWWGVISFFFNWFVLAANAFAWRRLSSLAAPTLSGELVADSPTGFRDVERAPDAEPKRRSRLRRIGPVLVAGFVLLGLAGWAWDATHHDHAGEAHGLPAPVGAIEAEMTQGTFTADDGSAVSLTHASCAGEGEAAPGGYTHFRCELTFADGTSDEVIVHLLEGDQLFFMSAQR
jgi:hypothetical protein